MWSKLRNICNTYPLTHSIRSIIKLRHERRWVYEFLQETIFDAYNLQEGSKQSHNLLHAQNHQQSYFVFIHRSNKTADNDFTLNEDILPGCRSPRWQQP